MASNRVRVAFRRSANGTVAVLGQHLTENDEEFVVHGHDNIILYQVPKDNVAYIDWTPAFEEEE